MLGDRFCGKDNHVTIMK